MIAIVGMAVGFVDAPPVKFIVGEIVVVVIEDKTVGGRDAIASGVSTTTFSEGDEVDDSIDVGAISGNISVDGEASMVGALGLLGEKLTGALMLDLNLVSVYFLSRKKSHSHGRDSNDNKGAFSLELRQRFQHQYWNVYTSTTFRPHVSWTHCH